MQTHFFISSFISIRPWQYILAFIREHNTSNQCWCNGGPPSATLAQHYQHCPTLVQCPLSSVRGLETGYPASMWFNVGPASQTMDQHWNDICLTSRVCWVQAATIRSTNVGLTLGQRRRRWPNMKSTFDQRLMLAGFDIMIDQPALSLLGTTRLTLIMEIQWQICHANFQSNMVTARSACRVPVSMWHLISSGCILMEMWHSCRLQYRKLLWWNVTLNYTWKHIHVHAIKPKSHILVKMT